MLENNGEGHLDRSCEKWCYLESKRKGISYVQYKGERVTRLVTSCVWTAFYNTLLRRRY